MNKLSTNKIRTITKYFVFFALTIISTFGYCNQKLKIIPLRTIKYEKYNICFFNDKVQLFLGYNSFIETSNSIEKQLIQKWIDSLLVKSDTIFINLEKLNSKSNGADFPVSITSIKIILKYLLDSGNLKIFDRNNRRFIDKIKRKSKNKMFTKYYFKNSNDEFYTFSIADSVDPGCL